MRNGSVIIVDKKEGETSFFSLREIKNSHKGEKVGHTGTLDKFASGLMVVLTGECTKLSPLFSGMGKKYLATMRFGSETDTLDPEGKVIFESGIPSEDEVREAVPCFVGDIMQAPPMYSAIHVGGKRAYKEAVKGNAVDMPERPVCIKSIEIISYDEKEGTLTFLSDVSKGTYIRSLARDIALKSGSRGHLIALRRLSVGPFTLDDVGNDDSESLLKRVTKEPFSLPERSSKAFSNGFLAKESLSPPFDSWEDGYHMAYLGPKLIGVVLKEGSKGGIVAKF